MEEDVSLLLLDVLEDNSWIVLSNRQACPNAVFTSNHGTRTDCCCGGDRGAVLRGGVVSSGSSVPAKKPKYRRRGGEDVEAIEAATIEVAPGFGF